MVVQLQRNKVYIMLQRNQGMQEIERETYCYACERVTRHTLSNFKVEDSTDQAQVYTALKSICHLCGENSRC